MSDWDWDWILKGSGLQPEDFTSTVPSQNPAPDADQAAGQAGATGGVAQAGVRQANDAQPPADTTPETPHAMPTTSSAGAQFIRRGEDYRNHIYTDATGNSTFGWGHKLTASEEGSLSRALPAMTEDQKRLLATSFLHSDLQNAEQIVHHKLGPAVHSLSQNQFDALVSDAFNAGYNGALGKTMIGAIRNGDFPAAGQQFNAYYGTVNGQRIKIDGLVRRNKNEAALFNNGDYSRPFDK